jgi:hypothetical protein
MNPTLLAKPYEVQARVSVDSFRVFLGAIGGSEATITSDNVSDLGRLCREFEFTAFAQKVDDWQSWHGSFDADMRRELQVLKTAMTDQRHRHERELCDLEYEVGLLRQASGSQREWEEREGQAVAEQLEDLRLENGRERLAVGEVIRVNK